MSELEELTGCFSSAGGDVKALAAAGSGHLAASGHRILSSRTVEGLELKAVDRVVLGVVDERTGIEAHSPMLAQEGL